MNQVPIWRKIPGFRSGKPWKMVIASVFYFFALLFIIALVSPVEENTQNKTAPKTQTQSAEQNKKDSQTQPSATNQASNSSQNAQTQKGLGITRQEIVGLYSQKGIDFEFQEGSPVNGLPQVIGKSPDGSALLQVIGHEDNITQISLMLAVPNDRPDIIAKNAVYLVGLLSKYAQGSEDWVTKEIEKAKNTNVDSTNVFGNKQVRVQTIKELGMICVTIEPV